MIAPVLRKYGIKVEDAIIEPLSGGLINTTWKISVKGETFIFQKINKDVFQKPEDIAFNIDLIGDYLKEHAPEYKFVCPVKALGGKSLVIYKNEYYRAFPFVQGSLSKTIVATAAQAFEAAKQFGKFTKLLKGFDCSQLRITIPSFHDLSLRYHQFIESLHTGNAKRISEAAPLIQQLKNWSHIVNTYENLKSNPDFKLRVTHHDTKISNVLFDNNDKGLCVIDLDTMMPGYFFSDVGDMMRTYLSPVNEEETHFSKIEVRREFYLAIIKGYYHEMKDELTAAETSHFFYAGTFMIYMQALRFLTDYLQDDIYYGARYEQHNLNRAKNQAVLLKHLFDKQSMLEKYAHEF